MKPFRVFLEHPTYSYFFDMRRKTCISPQENLLLTIPRRKFCFGSLLPVFWCQFRCPFTLLLQTIFSLVSVAEWPPAQSVNIRSYTQRQKLSTTRTFFSETFSINDFLLKNNRFAIFSYPSFSLVSQSDQTAI